MIERTNWNVRRLDHRIACGEVKLVIKQVPHWIAHAGAVVCWAVRVNRRQVPILLPQVAGAIVIRVHVLNKLTGRSVVHRAVLRDAIHWRGGSLAEWQAQLYAVGRLASANQVTFVTGS